MNSSVRVEDGLRRMSKPVLAAYGVAFLLVCSALTIYLIFKEQYLLILALPAVPLAALIITQPRLALYQYVFVLFIEFELVPSIPLYLMDISAALVILAALLDILLGNHVPRHMPRLSFNYLYIIIALSVCGILGFWPALAIRHVLSTGVLFATFLALYHLISKVSISELVNWFFVLAVLHSVYVLVPFIVSGGQERSYGLAFAIFGHQTQIALPVGLALYLGAARKRAPYYLVGTVIILSGLIATQSRAPIAFGLVSSLFVLIVAHSRVKSISALGTSAENLRRRIQAVVGIGIVLVGLVFVLKSSIFSRVLTRFDELLSMKPQGTLLWRIELWKKALTAFLHHPIFGVGPGGYKHLHEIFTSLHFAPTFPTLRRMTAHNLFLYYLAETGLLGTVGLIALVINQFHLARVGWLRVQDGLQSSTLALYGWAFLFTLSTMIDAAWMYGQLSFLAIFFAALVSRQFSIVRDHQPT